LDGGNLTDWYYKEDDKRLGPVSDEQVKDLAAKGVIKPETMVWNEFMAKWRTYAEAMGGASPAKGKSAIPAVAAAVTDRHKIDTPVDQTWNPFADTGSHAEIPSSTGQTSGPTNSAPYPPQQKTEYYCAICFRKKHISEMKSTPNGMACLSCDDNATYGIRTAGISVADASTYKVEFTGSGAEYFKIWIVNLLLTVLTLGIYSAWAKVRKNRYFYRNTRIAGSSFDYHGNPIAILKGRILAVIILAALNFSQKIDMTIYAVVFLLVMLIVPWMITRAYAFRLYNTSWRGIRLRFNGSVSDAYVVCLLYGCLTIITLGLCYPLFYRQMRLFLVNNASFGTTRSDLNVSAGDVYSVFIRTILLAFGIGIIMSIAAGLFMGLFISSLSAGGLGKPSPVMFIWIGIIVMSLYLLYRIIVQSFFSTRITNLMWDHTKLGTIRFEAFQRARDLASIIASNAILTFLTLGFYWPWARIQLAKYYADTMLVSAPEGLNNFVADVEASVSAAGDEISGALDVDFSF
jgi:uncharacterized membrane protein YjgN (DUF898 family)